MGHVVTLSGVSFNNDNNLQSKIKKPFSSMKMMIIKNVKYRLISWAWRCIVLRICSNWHTINPHAAVMNREPETSYTLLWKSFDCIRIESERETELVFHTNALVHYSVCFSQMKTRELHARSGRWIWIESRSVSCLNVLLLSDESVLRLTVQYYTSPHLHLNHFILKS